MHKYNIQIKKIIHTHDKYHEFTKKYKRNKYCHCKILEEKKKKLLVGFAVSASCDLEIVTGKFEGQKKKIEKKSSLFLSHRYEKPEAAAARGAARSSRKAARVATSEVSFLSGSNRLSE